MTLPVTTDAPTPDSSARPRYADPVDVARYGEWRIRRDPVGPDPVS